MNNIKLNKLIFILIPVCILAIYAIITLLFSKEAVKSSSFLINHDRSIYINGKNTRYYCKKIKQFNTEFLIATFQKGIFKITDRSLMKINTDYPKNPILNTIREIIDMTKSPNNDLYFITKANVYRIRNIYITRIKPDNIRSATRFSAIINFNKTLYLGTTFNGIYRQKGNEFEKVNAGLPREKYSWNEYFYDEIKEFFIIKNRLYCLTDYSKSIYRLNVTKNNWDKVEFHNKIDSVFQYNGKTYLKGKNNVLVYNGDINTFSSAGNVDQKHIIHIINGQLKSFDRMAPYYPFKKKKNFSDNRHMNRIGVFINLDYMKKDDERIIENLFQQKRINSLVINYKDDTGNLIYGSEILEAKEANASMLHNKFIPFMKRMKKYDPYIIARCVVFKDMRMFKYDDHKHALWDRKKNKPWKVKKIEYWVDPYSPFIQDYNIRVAREIESLKGLLKVDEIQFDYIRLPSDKSTSSLLFRYKPANWEKVDILDSYLSKARETINLPISIDIFGYNGIYRMGNWIGQDIETISRYVDIVCPMVYPSHFGSAYFARDGDRRVHSIIKFSVMRGKDIVFQDTCIRPFLQAFSYNTKKYDANYIKMQIDGNQTSGGDGYTFWNPGGKYSKLHTFLHFR